MNQKNDPAGTSSSAEQRAARAERALQISEARFLALIDGLEQVAVQGYDRQRRVVTWNTGSVALYGYSKQEALGQRLEDLIIPAAMREMVIASVDAWLAAGTVTMPAEELLLRRKDGQAVHVFSSHTMQVNLAGEAELYCVDIDLSERHRLAEQLRESQKLEAMGRLAGGIAHDFNNVLGGLLGNLLLAGEHLPPDHAARPHLALMEHGALHARNLVQQILTFSRRQAQQLKPVDLRALLDDTLGLLEAATPAGAVLELNLSAQPLWVAADATQLKQVLINLCTNAFYALQGRIGRVQLGLGVLTVEGAAGGDAAETGEPGPGHWAYLSVQDSGCGMDEQTRASLFEPFFTTKPIGEGSGLGLAVVHGIVSAHHGRIAVRSELGTGATFRLYLPLLAEPPAAQAQAAPDLHVLERLAPPSCGHHVLYLDDDEVMRLTSRHLLEQIGCRVSLFSSGTEALAALAADPQGFDLLITDFNMPGLSGVDVLRQLKQLRVDLPVILSSGYLPDSAQEEARRLGVYAFLRKEMAAEELAPLVQSALG